MQPQGRLFSNRAAGTVTGPGRTSTGSGLMPGSHLLWRHARRQLLPFLRVWGDGELEAAQQDVLPPTGMPSGPVVWGGGQE